MITSVPWKGKKVSGSSSQIVLVFTRHFATTMTVKWWNLSDPPCIQKVDSLMLGTVSSHMALYQLTLVMEPGRHILYMFLLLRPTWGAVMFTAGSPPFGTLGARYHYNPRYAQSISAPKIWKCRHRRSLTPEEGKLENKTYTVGGRWRWYGFLFKMEMSLSRWSELKLL